MEKWVNLGETICTDLSREKEFNEWYENVHVKDVLKTPGYVGARRYVIKEPCNGRGRYLAIYDIETNDINATMALRRELHAKEEKQGHSASVLIPNLYIPIWSGVLFRQISAQTPAK